MIYKNISEIWRIIEKDFKKSPTDQAGSLSELEILKAEKDLKISFNDQYKKFIKLYGGALVPAYFIYGLRKQRSMSDNLWSVIQNTKFYKEEQQWPGIDDWYVVSDDGSGNPIGIDPEGKVWLSDHDAGFEHIKLANSFEEFLYRLYTDTLYEDPDKK